MLFACLLKEKANKQQLVFNSDFVSRKQQPKGKVNAFGEKLGCYMELGWFYCFSLKKKELGRLVSTE